MHIRNPRTNQREPLAACRRKDNPTQCKANFPRNKWLVREAVVLCPNLIRQMDLPLQGRRCQLGMMHGPMNHESLNGTHPALLAAQRCNSDVQIPYRLPVIKQSHRCSDPSCLQNSDKLMIEVTQMAQDSQLGYACDYCTKRQPMGFNEVRECCNGLQALGENTVGNLLIRLENV